MSRTGRCQTSSVVNGVGGWVWDQNVQRLLRHLSQCVGYGFDDSDWGAVSTGLQRTDEDQGNWFDYPLVGERRLTVHLARNLGAAPVSIRVTGDLDEVLAARIETLFAVLSDEAH